MKKLTPFLFLAIIVVLGCKLPSSLKNITSGGVPEKGSSSSSKGTATGGSDPRQDVIEASQKFTALPYFTANMDGMGQTAIKSQIEYAAPDRFHIKYLGTGTGSGMEIIYIGKQSYMNLNGKWSKGPSSNTSIPNLRDSFTEEGLKTLTDVKFDGEDSVDGESALAYSYKNVTPVGNYPFTSKIWISQETGLPKKIYVEYTNGTLKNMTVNYDTETPVTIEPPIK